MRSAISSSAMTPKPTGMTRLVAVSNSTSAGTGESPRPSRPRARCRPPPRASLQRFARERDGEHVEAVALDEGAEQRPEHLAARAAGVAEIDQPVAIAEAGERLAPFLASLVRPDLLGERADRAPERVVQFRRRPDCAPERVGKGRGPLQRLLLEAQVGGHVLGRGIEDRFGPRLLQRLAHRFDPFRGGLRGAGRGGGGRAGAGSARSGFFHLAVAVEMPAEGYPGAFIPAPGPPFSARRRRAQRRPDAYRGKHARHGPTNGETCGTGHHCPRW